MRMDEAGAVLYNEYRLEEKTGGIAKLMLDLIKGCRFDGWMELEEGCSIAGEWLSANVGRHRIRTIIEAFAESKKEQQLTLWIEEPSGVDDENAVKEATGDSVGIVENIHYEVYYLDGLTPQLLSQILDFSGELLVNDGLAYFGILSEDGDEIGKYQCNIVRAHSASGNLAPIRKMFEENKIPYVDNLITAWDLSSDEQPVISSRYTVGGTSVRSTISVLEGLGLYKAELRETNAQE